MLFALSSALRASSIQHLSIKFMAKAKSYCRFSFKNGWRKGKAPLPVAFQEYAQDETLSVDYGGIYSQTERWRSGEEHSQFLLSFLHPYKPVISSTTSGWLKTVLMKSSIYTSTFKTHSTRSVSTSKTDLHGASIQGIFKRGS